MASPMHSNQMASRLLITLINGRDELEKHTVHDSQEGYDIWLSRKYYEVHLIERGRFGMVCQAINSKTNQKVAIKSIELKKGPRLISVLREIQISKNLTLMESKAIPKLLDIEIPANQTGSQWEFDTIHLVLEYFPANLRSIIESDTKMNDHDHKRLLANMLFGLRDLHYENIVHRDIKPSNMLVGSSIEEPEKNLKLCDFGMARAMKRSHNNDWMVYQPGLNPWSDDEQTTEEEEGEVTATDVLEENKTVAKESSSAEVSSSSSEEEVSSSEEEELTDLEIKRRNEDMLTTGLGTIGYRAPELTLNCAVYHKPADIWAVGCVFAELVTKRKLFTFEGESNEDQFNAIISKMGSSFISEDLTFIDNREGLKLAQKKKRESLHAPTLSAHFKKPDGKNGKGKEKDILLLETQGIKLLKELLWFDPRKRITVQNALRSPYLSDIYKELRKTYVFPKRDEQIEEEWEKHQSVEQIKEQIWREMQDFYGYKEGAEPKVDEKHQRRE